MKLAVLGGGLFGSTAAIYAARAGHEVHLYEPKPRLMAGATASTFARLHRGYHYPRDPATGRESRAAEAAFRKEYGGCVIDGGRQLYIVPPYGSRVSLEAFRTFLDDEGLPFSEDGGRFHVMEPRINLAGLATLVRQKVKEAGVTVHYGETAPATVRKDFDQIVVATYSSLNETLWELGCAPLELKFQVVEKAVVLMPPRFRDTSVVVIDGQFGCIDPLDDTPLHVVGHVTEAVHWEGIGYRAEIPADLIDILDRGLLRKPRVTGFGRMQEELAAFVSSIKEAEHIGSMFTVRAVLANREETDARPTLLQAHDQQVMSVFSGKLGTSVTAAMCIAASMPVTKRVAA